MFQQPIRAGNVLSIRPKKSSDELIQVPDACIAFWPWSNELNGKRNDTFEVKPWLLSNVKAMSSVVQAFKNTLGTINAVYTLVVITYPSRKGKVQQMQSASVYIALVMIDGSPTLDYQEQLLVSPNNETS